MPILIEGNIARAYISKMKPYRKTAPIRAVQIPDDFTVIQNSDDAQITGKITAVRGSYLAMAATGILYPIAADTFESQYEPIEGEPE